MIPIPLLGLCNAKNKSPRNNITNTVAIIFKGFVGILLMHQHSLGVNR